MVLLICLAIYFSIALVIFAWRFKNILCLEEVTCRLGHHAKELKAIDKKIKNKEKLIEGEIDLWNECVADLSNGWAIIGAEMVSKSLLFPIYFFYLATRKITINPFKRMKISKEQHILSESYSYREVPTRKIVQLMALKKKAHSARL